jgi:hypothetical protein
MNAQKLAFFIFAFVIAGGIINGSGIFTQVSVPDVDMPTADLADGIVETNDVSSDSDLSTAFDGWAMVKSMYSTVKTVFGVLAVPYYYLRDLGVPVAVALGIQSMVTLSEVWGMLQLISNRSTKGMD